MKPIKFVVIGIGGYSLVHIQAVEWLEELGLAKLVGVVALEEERKTKLDNVNSLEDKGIQLYKSIDHFFETGVNTADALTVPIGIHMHVPVSIQAMQAGLDVYCEKPIAATVQEVDKLIEAKNKTGRKITIGYQHIYSNSMQSLKKRICSGKLGKVNSASLLCGWPRSLQYFQRNNWAGKLKVGKDWILDSPANNAQSHYLLNTLFLSSPDPKHSANPVEVQAELYRANQIESTDLVQMKIKTDTGTDCHIILAHSNWKELGPRIKLECEKGTITWQNDIGESKIKYTNGETEEFRNDTHKNWRLDGFKDFVEAIQKNRDPICIPELARPQTVAINAMHENCPEIIQVPEEFITEKEDYEMFPPDSKGNFRRINDLDKYLVEAFENNVFLSKLRIPWAKKVKPI